MKLSWPNDMANQDVIEMRRKTEELSDEILDAKKAGKQITMIRPKATSENAVELLKTYAAAGDASAQYSLGQLFAKGEGVPKDLDAAVRYWEKAAKMTQCAAYCGKLSRG